MIHFARLLCLTALSLLTLTCIVDGQTGSRSQAPGATKPTNAEATPIPDKAAETEAARILRERQTHAQSLLTSLAVEAGSFRDQRLRAQTLSRIADMLWVSDPERGRTLFRKAWDAAVIADAEEQQRVQEEIRNQKAKSPGGGYSVSPLPELRDEIVRLAAKRDVALGEELLAKLKEQKEREGGGVKSTPSQARDSAAAQRLGVASQLLAAGETQEALRVADPLLGTVSNQTLSFLSTLREKNPAAADERYAAMLPAATADPQSDANTASLLSSYIFTPYLYVTFIGAGGSTISRGRRDPTAPPDVSPALRAAYLRTAYEILMRSIPQPGRGQNSGSIVNKYYVVKRLLPLFEQFAPVESTAGLRAQLEALSSMITEGQRQAQEETVREGIRPQKPPEDRDQPLLNEVDRVRTSAERDSLFLKLAMIRAESGDLKAREYVDRIEDSELRHNLRAYIDAVLAMKFVEGRDAERALEIARTGELTPVLRVWIMARAARLLLVKRDQVRALQLADEALTVARGMDKSDPDRAGAFFAVADLLLTFDRPRGWDAAMEAVRAANSAESFTGTGGFIAFSITTKGSQSSHRHSVGEFNVDATFRALARDDFERTVELAGVFEREGPRANAVIAIADTVLTEKK